MAVDGPARVLDLTSTLGGAYCGRLLAAGGLDVTRVEPPGGHWLRRWSASGATIPDGESGALFQWLAGGQRSVIVDPDDAADGAALAEWASTMDAVLWSPGRGGPPLGRIGRGAGRRPGRRRHRHHAVRARPGRGPTAPATELTLQALSGGPALRARGRGRR